jgi:hypothetical protein
MKKRMTDTLAGPSAAQGAVAATIPSSVLMALPKRSTLNRQLRRHQHKILTSGNAQSALPPCPTDLTFTIPDRFTSFVLYDSGSGADRFLLMGCSDLLDGLARAPLWLADGTFKVVPNLFFQLYSIHFQFVTGINPAAVYCLLPNKTRTTYDRVFRQLKLLIPTASPDVIMTDFETAAMSAFKDAFPDAQITGCYFHLTQSVLRKVNEIGLKVPYETDDAVRGSVRCLAALAHVPETDVSEAFDLLVDEMPAVDHIDELITYFEHTW